MHAGRCGEKIVVSLRLLSGPISTSPGARRHDCARASVVVVGAGPYGLAAAAHLLHAGVDVRIFGEPMESWARHMPVGMLLRSRREASDIADPNHALGLDGYERAGGLERAEPVPVARFVEYGRWFQERAVAGLERRRVVSVSPDASGFRVELDDAECVRAKRVVVAAGIVPFAWRPPQLARLPPALVSHTADYHDLGAFAGRRVLVVGGGQSALESAVLLAEGGAEAEVLVRRHDVRWLPQEGGEVDRGLQYHAYRKIALGGPRSAWLAAWPAFFRRLPYRAREPFIHHFVRPAGAGWLPARLEPVPIVTGRSIVSAAVRGDRLVLTLDDGSTREVDHVLAATGYQVDLARYAFLAPELVAGVRTRNGWPVLADGFASPTPRSDLFSQRAAGWPRRATASRRSPRTASRWAIGRVRRASGSRSPARVPTRKATSSVSPRYSAGASTTWWCRGPRRRSYLSPTGGS